MEKKENDDENGHQNFPKPKVMSSNVVVSQPTVHNPTMFIFRRLKNHRRLNKPENIHI